MCPRFGVPPKVYRGGVQIATTPSTSYSNSGLVAGSTYTYTVSAYDIAGNTSAQSASASVTTQALPPVASKFMIEDRVRTTTNINVRPTACNSGKPGKQKANVLGTVIAGPKIGCNYTWYQINFDAGSDGWVVEDSLVK